MKARDAERQSAIERLREWVKPGDTIYTELKHRSRSGMSRVIQVLQIENNEPRWLGYNVALAVGNSYDREREGVRVGGCGMDMGFALVYELSQTLFPDGFGCLGKKCPSNDHPNGDRDYTRHNPCNCLGCAVCGGERVICGECGMCTRCHDHRTDCKGCPGDGTRTPFKHWHQSGGYALRHRWL